MKKALVVCHMGRHYRKFGHYDIKPLQELGYEVHFAANFNQDIDKVKDDSIILHQVDYQRSPFSLKNIKAYKQIKQIIKENDFDLIHCQSPVGGVLTRLANKNLRHKSRIIYTAHGFHFYKGAPITMWLLFYPIEKYLAKYTDTIITINKEDYNLAKNRFCKRCKKIEYIPGIGIDSSEYKIKMTKKERYLLRNSIGLKEDDFVLIFPARLDKNKNQIFLIDAMEILVKKYPNIYLLLPGTDDLNGFYQGIVKDKKISNNIKFLGQRNDIVKLLKVSNIAVSSSLREGLPINILEAFIAGKPVVALKCRGMSDLIEDNKNGYIVNNKKEFINKIIYLHNNADIVKNISLENTNKYKKFESTKVILKIRDIFGI